MTDVPITSLRKRKINPGKLGVLRGLSQPLHHPSSNRHSSARQLQERLNTSAYVFEPQVEIFHKKKKVRKAKPQFEFGYKQSAFAMPAKSFGETEFSLMCIENQSEQIVSLNDDLFPDMPLMPEDIVQALPSPLREVNEEQNWLELPADDYEPNVKPQTTSSRFKNTPRALKDILHFQSTREHQVNIKAFDERRYATLITDPRMKTNPFEKLPDILKKFEPADLPRIRRKVKQFG
mmetsp:Transcript_5807/g.10339  ORF Transcript_5807/g.10339 Transcript_5807/m.10339 type:complete len:235 (+) Transcript_5807:606-1310(+)